MNRPAKLILGEKQTVSRQQAALQQIHMAIRLFTIRDFACAITLALAAEEQLPNANVPYLFKRLKDKVARDDLDKFNYVRNWLKHHKEPDQIDIYEFEVVIALARATSKFNAVYQQSSEEIETFIQWARDRGYPSGPKQSQSI